MAINKKKKIELIGLLNKPYEKKTFKPNDRSYIIKAKEITQSYSCNKPKRTKNK